MEKGGKKVRVVGNYLLEKRIGSGSFSLVWRARHIHHHGNKFAIKEIATEKLCQKLRDSLMSEIDILRQIKHPNIIALYDIVNRPRRIFLVLEYCSGGDLASYIKRNGRLSQAVVIDFMIQLAAGLNVLREKNLIHRDLKPQNLLLSRNDSNAVLKIADFGFARFIQPQGLAETLCGSPLYMAPEIMQSAKYDAKADLWSVGTILFELVTGNPPFSGNSQMELLQNIVTSNGLQFPVNIVGELLPDCIDLCKKLLRRNPIERLSFEEFFNHRFLQVQTVRVFDHHADNSMGAPENSVVETAEASQSMGSPGNSDAETAEASQSMGSPGNSDAEITEASQSMGPAGNLVAETAETLQHADCLPCSKKSPAGKEEASDNLDRGTDYMRIYSSKYNLPGSFENTPASTFEGIQAAKVEELVDKIPTVRLGSPFECIEEEKVLIVELGSSFECIEEEKVPIVELGSSFECIEEEDGLVKNAHADSREISSVIDASGQHHSKSFAASGQQHNSESFSVVSSPKETQKSIIASVQVFGKASRLDSLKNQRSVPLETCQASVSSQDVLDKPSDQSLIASMQVFGKENCRDSLTSQSPVPLEACQASVSSQDVLDKPSDQSLIASMQVFGKANCRDSLKSQSSVPLKACQTSVSSQDALDKPSDHAPTRLDCLHRYAHAISELAKEKLKVGQPLEALAIQIVCLAVWKQALYVCHRWSATLTETSPIEGLVAQSLEIQKGGDLHRVASSCLETEHEFLSEVESAEELLSHLGPLDNNAELPDAMEIVFQTALALGRKGAVYELLEEMDNATALYLKSITFLSFILGEASSLELNPPFSLSIFYQQRLHRYINRLTHHKQSIAHNSALIKRVEKQTL